MRSKQKLVLLIVCISLVRVKADIGLIPGSEPLRQIYGEATLVCRCSFLSVKIVHKENIPGDLHGNTYNIMSALLKEDKVFRTQKNWSQAQLAEACGMDDSHLGEIERGELDFCLGTAAKIAKGLGITISDLFAGVA
jgi:DNA-binding XRE family transcriptional regulator